MADFYCRVFGSQVLPRPAFRAGGYWIGTPGIFPQIHIIQSDMTPPGPGAPISPVARHTAFEVADMDAMTMTLEREGINYVVNVQLGGRVQTLQRRRRQHARVPAGGLRCPRRAGAP